jgi:hypothetical protein
MNEQHGYRLACSLLSVWLLQRLHALCKRHEFLELDIHFDERGRPDEYICMTAQTFCSLPGEARHEA